MVVLTQGGSLYDITVGAVVNIDIHSMMFFYLHTAGDGQEIESEQVQLSHVSMDLRLSDNPHSGVF